MVVRWSKVKPLYPEVIGLSKFLPNGFTYTLISAIVSEDVHGRPLNSFQAFTKLGVQWIKDSMRINSGDRKVPSAP